QLEESLDLAVQESELLQQQDQQLARQLGDGARQGVPQLLARALQPRVAQFRQRLRITDALRQRRENPSCANAKQICDETRQLDAHLFQQGFQLVLQPHAVVDQLHAPPCQS